MKIVYGNVEGYQQSNGCAIKSSLSRMSPQASSCPCIGIDDQRQPESILACLPIRDIHSMDRGGTGQEQPRGQIPPIILKLISVLIASMISTTWSTTFSHCLSKFWMHPDAVPGTSTNTFHSYKFRSVGTVMSIDGRTGYVEGGVSLIVCTACSLRQCRSAIRRWDLIRLESAKQR